jgi:urease accessory protein
VIRRFATSFLIAAAVPAAPAFAHSPIKGIGTFYNGLLHPVLVPAHLLALIAVGLLIGQHAPRSSRTSLAVFGVAVASALAVAAFAAPIVPQWLALVVALAGGLAVAASWSGGWALPVLLALLGGAFVGLDSAPDGIEAQQTWLALSGTALGAGLIVIYFGGLAAWLDRPWQKIAVRALGSWIAACALLVLSLDLMTTGLPA